MGEYYLKNEMSGDAESMYKKAVEQYPFASYAKNVLAGMAK